MAGSQATSLNGSCSVDRNPSKLMCRVNNQLLEIISATEETGDVCIKIALHFRSRNREEHKAFANLQAALWCMLLGVRQMTAYQILCLLDLFSSLTNLIIAHKKS